MLGIVRRSDDTALSRPQTNGLTRWDPWGDFARIRSEMDNLFGGVFGAGTLAGPTYGAMTPQVELYEDGEKFTLNASLPGISSEDIHLELAGKTVHIWGESKPTIPERDVTVHLAQRSHGQFDLRYTLPVEVNAETAVANYHDGILELQMPKVEPIKPKTVQVQVQK